MMKRTKVLHHTKRIAYIRDRNSKPHSLNFVRISPYSVAWGGEGEGKG
jgi:hypothetical protein